MRLLKIRLAVAVAALAAGVSIDSHIRCENSGQMRDCFCSTARCRRLLVADNPITSPSHPVETARMFVETFRRD